MSTWTVYWPEWMCDAAREQGLTGQPLRLLWGGHNQASTFHGKLAVGDLIVPISVSDGVIHPLAGLRIKERTDAERWLAAHPEDAKLRMHGCGGQLIVGEPVHPLDFGRALTGRQAEAWRFESPNGPRALKFLVDGKITRTLPLQGVFRLTVETAAMLDQVLAAATPKSAAPLEQQYAAKPADEQLARVLADQWLERGDPRGELLTLELELSHCADLAAAVALDKRLAAAARALKNAKQLPGGFPFRPMWGTRTFIELTAQSRPLTGSTPEQKLRPLAALFEPGTKWKLKQQLLTLGEVVAKKSADPLVTLEGELLVPGTKTPLPLQAAALWVRSRPVSEVWVDLGRGTATYRLRVPEGCPVCTTAAKALLKPGWKAQRMQRTSRGDQPA